MSLQVWLPLNGNLNNQGLSNAEIIATGATVNASGKIGSCYSFDGSDDLISINCPDLYKTFSGGSQQFSIAFWIYHADATRAVIFGDYNLTGTIGFNIELTTGHQIRFYWNGSPDKNFAAATAVAASGWTHIALTYNGSKLNIYKNGILQSDSWSGTLATKNKTSGLFYLGRDSRTGATVLNGRLNDFRIYDHALSTKEVEEISKGLILHYPLNRSGLGNENLIIGTDNWSTWYKGSRWTASNEILTYSAGSVAWNDADSPCIPWTDIDGKTITISCELRSDDFNYTSGSGFSLCLIRKATQATQNYSNRRRECTPIHLTANQITTDWVQFSYTYNNFSDSNFVNTYNGGGGDWFGIYLWNYTDKSLQIRKIKIEYGNKTTQWCPNVADDLYSRIGLNSNIIYDTSGYEYNGEVINNISYQLDSPRYLVSAHMSATNQKIKISNFPTAGFGNSYTFAWWEKISSVTPMHWGFADGIRLNGMYTGRLWNTGDGSNNPLYTPGTTTQVAAPSTGVWHHWVMTGDGTTCKVYQNGALWGQAKTYKAISGSTIYINGWDSGTSYCSDNASMSDFRIYCTALTAEQVKELYDISAAIDKNGNVYAREVIEE